MNLKQILELAKKRGEATLGDALKYADIAYIDDPNGLDRIYSNAARVGTYFCTIDSCLEKLNHR